MDKQSRIPQLVAPSFLAQHPPAASVYPLSLHDAPPISIRTRVVVGGRAQAGSVAGDSTYLPIASDSVDVVLLPHTLERADRKSTRLNSSHVEISYAVFCLKKKKVQ